MELDEVDNMAVNDAIEQISERAANNEGQRHRQPAIVGVAAQHPQQYAGDHDSDHDEELPLPARGVGEEAKRGPRVVDQHPVEEWRDVTRLSVLKRGVEVVLGR